MQLLQSLRAALSLVCIFTVLLGGIYTYAVTGLAQLLFPNEANGSLIERGDEILGSRLIGQQFTGAGYFWGRISALSDPYNPANSGGSNLSVNNPKLVEQVNNRVAALQKVDPGNKQPIPVNLVTASASGLDPHITLEAALYQLTRVSKARGFAEDEVKELIDKNRGSALFGLQGEDFVNVVSLNLDLDDMSHGEGKKEKR